MNESSLLPSSQPRADAEGVRGWLLALCVMLTVIGPMISVWLIANDYANASPLASKSVAVQALLIASFLLSASAAAFGAYAGVRLWLVLPNAVITAKYALLLGLGVDIVTTMIQTSTAQEPGDRLLFQVEVNLLPSLIFFTLCYAYLNHSKRVHAIYGP